MTKTTIDLPEAKRFLSGVPQPVLAAVSGGRDSMCLLHVLHTWGKANCVEVVAAHFNHHLRGESADRDEAFVKQICAEWEIPCVCGSGDTRAYAEQAGLSLEEAARVLRYRFLEETRLQKGCVSILTAHHADDHAETMLLNLLRGTGLQGLTGIPAQREHIFRPFLQVTRAELEAYATKHNIPFVEDETNALDDAARNVLRHKVLPVLKELNPRAVENMSRTAELLTQDARVLELAVGTLLNKTAVIPGEKAELPLAVCEHQPRAVLSRAVLSLLVSVGGHQKDLAAAHVEAVLDLIRGEYGREVSLPYGMTARREKDTLRIVRRAAVPESCTISVGETVNFGSWRVALGKEAAPNAYAIAETADLAITTWRPQDRLNLAGSRGPRSLKRLFADAGIAPADRDVMPVLRLGDQIVAVAGIGVDLAFVPKDECTAIYVSFQNENSLY
jgi:tRNA(Ile)-lysidine synthase